jgi:hypothetical protein
MSESDTCIRYRYDQEVIAHQHAARSEAVRCQRRFARSLRPGKGHDTVVEWHDEAAAVGQFRRLAGAHALNAIMINSFPPEYFEMCAGRESHFQRCAALARTIEVFELRQNRNPETLRSDFGRSPDGLRPDWFRAEKFHVPVAHAQTPLPLARVCVLEPPPLWQNVTTYRSVVAQAGGYRGSSRARG